MKRSSIGIKSIFMAVLALTFLIPMSVFAKNPFYVDFKPGIYSTQSSDLHGFDTGFNGEMAFGYQFSPNIAAEFGVGYFYTEGRKTAAWATYVRRELDIDVYPVTFTLKAILPYKKWEFFGLAGAGVYVVAGAYDVEDYDHHHDHYDYDDDEYDYDALLGGYLGAGIHYNITPRIFVGAEGKYLWTNKAKLEYEEFGVPLRVKFKMDGFSATAVIGIRF